MLKQLRLRCSDPARVAAFYQRLLGWHPEGAGLVCAPGGTQLVLETSSGPARLPPSDPGQVYWKLGMAVPELLPVAERLRAQGVDIGQPEQFGSVGFLCHVRDPAGFTVELLQQTFAGGPPRPGAGQVLGQISLRVRDLEASLAFYQRQGMRELARIEVPQRGFELVFLAFSDEQLPSGSLRSQREWLWQRRYTTLELVYRPGRSQPYSQPEPGQTGLGGLRLEVEGGTEAEVMTDPDGVLVEALR